jgi:hypothetical protein
MDAGSDAMERADPRGLPPNLGSAQFSLLTSDDNEEPLIFIDEPQTPNERVAARVYGGVLTISAQGLGGAVQILVRLEDLVLPDSVTPAIPGSDSWISMVSADDEIYSTQFPSGSITLDSCPQAIGDRVIGAVNQVYLAHLTEMSQLPISGFFDLPLEAIDLIPACRTNEGERSSEPTP